MTSLQKRGIRAEYMGSAQTDGTVQDRAEDGEIDILYMTAEKACSVSERSGLHRPLFCTSTIVVGFEDWAQKTAFSSFSSVTG